jgi:hypothetical protein
MNAILFYNFDHPIVNGSLINSLEYFLASYQHNKEIKLIFLNTKEETKQLFISIIYERYNLEGLEGFEDNIVLMSLNKEFLESKFNTVLVLDYSTINKTRGLINSKKLLVISEKHLDDPKYFYSKEYSDVTYYGEMPFHYKDHLYKMKMLFDRYKDLKYTLSGTYIHSPKNPNRSFVKDLSLPSRPIIFRRPGHEPNFFCKFDTFVYYHAHKWFDPSPRLMHECYFYGKDVLYFNKFNLKDGSYYRYKDLIENGLKDRILSKDDEIVRQLI